MATTPIQEPRVLAGRSPDRWSRFFTLAYRQATCRERMQLVYLTALRTLVGLSDLVLATAMYALFVLLQGGKLEHHPWWTPRTVLAAALSTTCLVLVRSGMEIASLHSVVEYTQEQYTRFMLRLTRGYAEMQWERFVMCNRGELMHHTIQSARDVSNYYQSSIELTAAVLVVTSMACALVYQSPHTAAALILLGTAFYGVNRIFIRGTLRSAATRKESTLRMLHKTLADLYASGKEVRTYANHGFFYRKIERQAHALKRENLRLMILPQVTRNMVDQGVVLLFLAVVVLVQLRHRDMHQILALLVFYFVISRRLLPLVGQISYIASEMTGSLASVQFVEEELAHCTRFGTPAIKSHGPRNGFILELEDISFRFGTGPQILKKVSFHQRPGEIVVLRGPSGSGKSSLLNIIAGIAQPSQGVVRVHHDDIAYVPQEIVLLDDTVRANLLFGLDSKSDDDLLQALAAAELRHFVLAQPMGLDTHVGDNGILFSGGQRQRLGLARAMVRNPRLLLLDEATSALDQEAETQVLGHLRRCGVAILLSTHRVSTRHFGNRDVCIADGRFIDDAQATS